ncbi:hypothetical protein BaRGS_00032863 [Batillaria attramentaria]|uniref:Uncharacterized protein n=1 Tax=Batillaria attramentaria TaxID=370345 RepID=A0ABD0JLP3_9CAEN
MSGDKISEPVGVQTPDVHEWRRSLRSPSPSGKEGRNPLSQSQPTPKLRSRSPSPGALGRTSLRSRSPSPSRVTIVKHAGSYLTDVGRTSQKKLPEMNNLRKSTGNMADFSSKSKGGKAGELSGIEAEYIRNLQQQVYFLELEANYLREQARKATEMHPQMVQEADRMLSKLRLMQSEMDGMSVEIQRKDSSISIIAAEKQRLEEQLREVEEARMKDKRLLMDEVVTLKTEKDRLERELSRKDGQLLEAKSSVDKSAVALKNAETKIQTLKAQLEQRIEQHNLTQLALEEKRSELVSMETQLREVEDKYYSSSVQIQDKVTQDLRDEIRFLRQKLKETEMSADKDRYLRDKINEDSSHLVRENASLSQQVLELQKQLEREKGLRESNDQRHATSISEMVGLRDKEGALRLELDKLREQLKHEQDRSKQYLEQLTNKETACSTAERRLNTNQSRITELEGLQKATEAEVTQLKRDKVLLVEHVADLQKKIEDKDRQIIELRGEMATLESRLKQTEYQKTLELSAQSQKWEEFGRLAESMRTLSSTMAQTTTPRSKLHL